MRHIDLVLLTGMFGSGKTTFLHHFLTQYPEKRIGVIMNDYGAFRIDPDLLAESRVEVRELVNGSIFCRCLSEQFKAALKAFSFRDIDCLAVECSGISDPSGVQKYLADIGKECGAKYRYLGTICILDAPEAAHDLKTSALAGRQLACSSLTVVNKADLIGAEQREEIESCIRKIQPEIMLRFTSYGTISYPEIEEGLNVRETDGRTINTRASAPEVYSLMAEGFQNPDAVRRFVQAVAPFTMRIKGYVTGREQTIYIEGIRGNVSERAVNCDFNGGTRIVMIGYDDTDFYEETRRFWEELVQTPYCLYD